MTANMSSQEESLRRIVEYLVDEVAEPGGSPITPRELLEVLRKAAPTVADQDSGWMAWRIAERGNVRRIADFGDAVFDLGLDFMEAVQGPESTTRAELFDIRELPSIVERIGQASENETVRRATKTATFTVEISERRNRWSAGDVLAIPVGSKYRFAVVLPKTSFGWAVGVLEGPYRVPRLGSVEHPTADTWFYTEISEYLAGRWLSIRKDKSLVDLFPEVLERFFCRPVVVPPEMAAARFGFAETPDGALRMLDEDEANEVGVLDGNYRQSRLSRDAARFLSERSRGQRARPRPPVAGHRVRHRPRCSPTVSALAPRRGGLPSGTPLACPARRPRRVVPGADDDGEYEVQSRMTHTFARHRSQYDAFLSRMRQVVDSRKRLPDWPFRSELGKVDICEYNEFSDDDFTEALEALARAHDDESISLVVVDPDPEAYQIRDLGHFPAFSVPTGDIGSSYWEAVSYEPQGDPGGAVLYADAFAIFGESGSWAVWGQRDWEVVLVRAEGTTRPWREQTDIFVSPEVAVQRFIQPELGGSRWSRAEIDGFVSRMSDPRTR